MQRPDLDYASYHSQSLAQMQKSRRTRSNVASMKVDKLNTWDKVQGVKKFDESKYPPWLFKHNEDPTVNRVLQPDEHESQLQADIGSDHEEFDLRLAEHRARALEKDLGIDVQRKGKDLYNAGGKFMIEMNLHTAGRSLADLIDKVENNLLSEDHQSSSKMVNKSIRSSKSVMSQKNSSKGKSKRK